MKEYKNTSLSVKTFYGKTFNPGEIHSVPGFINDDKMIRVTTTRTTKKTSTSEVATKKPDADSSKLQSATTIKKEKEKEGN